MSKSTNTITQAYAEALQAMIAEAGRDDEQFVSCMTYLMMADPTVNSGQRMTQDEIAEAFGYSRVTLWRNIQNWTDSGVMQQAQDMVRRAKMESVRLSLERVLSETPAMIDRMLGIATDPNEKAANSIAAFRELWNNIVAKVIDQPNETATEPARIYIEGLVNASRVNKVGGS